MRVRSVSILCAITMIASVPAALAQTPAPEKKIPSAKIILSKDPPAPATAEKKPAPKPVGMARYTMTAGDLDGDGISESIIYDSESKAIRVIDYSGEAPIQTMGIFTKDVPTEMVAADLNGDGKAELITGEGLGGYNPKEGPQTDVTVKIYKPVPNTDWSPLEIYRKASERPQVTSLHVKDLDGDGLKDILFAYFASKYMVDLRIAKGLGGTAWTITELPAIRMGAHVAAGDVLQNGKQMIVVGRPYGDPPDAKSTTAIGDAFILDGDQRIPLPVTRGVSSVAVGDLDGDKKDEIIIGDGWHANYGKLARSRLAVLWRDGDGWKYELVEDLDNHLRFEKINLADLNGDGKTEIVAWASRNSTLGGSVRVYERSNEGWRGMTTGELAQAYAVGNFNDDKKPELVFTGQPPLPFSMAAQPPKWETKLGQAVETKEIDPKTLLAKPAPALKAIEWLGADAMNLGDLKGKVVLLDFWATWCKPCIEMYPEMRTWASEFGPQGLVILGITNHSRQSSAQIQRFFRREKLPWPIAVDPKSLTHIDYGVSPIPHTFLIDRDGVVRLEHRGGGDLTVIKNKIRELLAAKSAAAK